MTLLVISTHPIQYQAPVYRALQQQFHIPTTVIYGSDFSVAGYRDREFGTSFSWDTDLLSGYTSIFLSHAIQGRAQSYEAVTTTGLAPLVRKGGFQAVLLLGYQPRFHLEAFWAARRTGVPLLLRTEASDSSLVRNKIKQRLRDTFLHMFYREFARLLYIGEESRSHYLRFGCTENKLLFSPYCVDTGAFKDAQEDRTLSRAFIRRDLEIPLDKIVVLFSGKIVPRKAPDLLLSALKTLPEVQRSRLTLMFLGDGELRSQLEAEAQKEPSIDVRFVGFRNQSELSRYYHASDMLVLPSRRGETWGLVVNEALYHGLPCVVSSRVGCASDLVKPGTTGEIFTADSADELAGAIQRCCLLIEQPDTATRCKELVSHYSIEAAARGIAQAYNEVTTGK